MTITPYEAGYMAYPNEWSNLAGAEWQDGWLQAQSDDAMSYDDGYDWSPVEQGMYDDDPSPYNGDYSEM